MKISKKDYITLFKLVEHIVGTTIISDTERLSDNHKKDLKAIGENIDKIGNILEKYNK